MLLLLLLNLVLGVFAGVFIVAALLLPVALCCFRFGLWVFGVRFAIAWVLCGFDLIFTYYSFIFNYYFCCIGWLWVFCLGWFEFVGLPGHGVSCFRGANFGGFPVSRLFADG